jgi:hypothetical protein
LLSAPCLRGTRLAKQCEIASGAAGGWCSSRNPIATRKPGIAAAHHLGCIATRHLETAIPRVFRPGLGTGSVSIGAETMPQPSPRAAARHWSQPNLARHRRRRRDPFPARFDRSMRSFPCSSDDKARHALADRSDTAPRIKGPNVSTVPRAHRNPNLARRRSTRPSPAPNLNQRGQRPRSVDPPQGPQAGNDVDLGPEE